MREIKHRTVETNGIRMHVAEQGTGPLVILCHGFPESWYSWRPPGIVAIMLPSARTLLKISGCRPRGRDSPGARAFHPNRPVRIAGRHRAR